MKQITNTALLVMDMQSSILKRIPNASELIENINEAITIAKENNIPVIYVKVGFRTGAPGVSAKNKIFSSVTNQLNWTEEFAKQWLEIHPDILIGKNPFIVTKRRVSAFTGSDLEVLLRGLNIEHLILTGIATSGVVLSTLKEAADKDYILTVINDCCIDPEPEVHQFLVEKLFPKQAEVISLKEWK